MNQEKHPLYAIVAMAENRVIGRDNQLPWHLPEDLKHFKTITSGHTILMGRKTFESIGRPLPNRTNLVLTRDQDYFAPGCIVVHSLDQALAESPGSEPIFLIGGAALYQQYMPAVSTLYLTLIHATIKGDSYFPTIDYSEWQEDEREEHAADEQHPYSYSFMTLTRKPT